MSFIENITIAARSKHPLTVHRLGYGTMRLTGEGIYGEPPDRPGAIKILQEAAANGINFFDTADYYGEDVTNRLLYEALYPYQPGTVICTKVGGARKPDKSWIEFNSPQNIRESIENNLRTLRQEQIQLVHFRIFPGSTMPFTASLEAMFQLQREGKILHVGVSNVSREELLTAMKMGDIATVENMYGHGQRTSTIAHHVESRGGEEVLDICEANNIPLIPYFSLVQSMPKKDERIARIADKYGATPVQVNIAWLLHRWPWLLPIPGTSSMAHFKENLAAGQLSLTKEDMEFLD